jgi:hypothetical protein
MELQSWWTSFGIEVLSSLNSSSQVNWPPLLLLVLCPGITLIEMRKSIEISWAGGRILK